jgi:hypothetical protein
VRAIKDYAHHKKVQQFAGKKANFSSPRNRQVIQESSVEQGLFLCQNRGQNYLTVAKYGHSIAFGPTPIGKPIVEQVAMSSGPGAVVRHENKQCD